MSPLLRIVAANCSLQTDVVAKLLLQAVTASCYCKIAVANCCYSLFSQIIVIVKWLLQIVTTTVVVTKIIVASCYRKLLSQIVAAACGCGKIVATICCCKLLQDWYCQLLSRNCYWTVVRDRCFN
jgi:hypothetical protein